MYQAFISFRPASDEVEWLDHTGTTHEEVARLVRNDPRFAFSWQSVYIKQVSCKKTGTAR